MTSHNTNNYNQVYCGSRTKHTCTCEGRIQDFKLGGAHLKIICRAEGGVEILGVFRVKNHDFMPKNHIFSNFRGTRTGCAPPPPGSAPACNTHHSLGPSQDGYNNLTSDKRGLGVYWAGVRRCRIKLFYVKTCSVQLCILDQPRVDNSNRLKAGPGCLKTLTNTLLEVLSGVHVQLDLSWWSEVTDFFIQSLILRSRDKIVILVDCRNLTLIFFRFLTTLLLHFCTSTSNAVVIFVEQK